jgi:hypothetical protein
MSSIVLLPCTAENAVGEEESDIHTTLGRREHVDSPQSIPLKDKLLHKMVPINEEQKPTWKQRLSVASYIYFIPVCLALNLLCLCNRYTALLWFL